MLERVRQAAPIFFGVVIGVWATYSGLAWFVVAGALLALAASGGCFWGLGFALLGSRPVAAVRIWQGSVLTAVAVIAATAAALALVGRWLTRGLGGLPAWAVSPTAVKSETDHKAILDLLTGALSTLAGGLWLDDAKKPEGSLWPAAQLSKGFETRFRPLIAGYKTERAAAAKPDEIRRLDDLIAKLEEAVTGQRIGWGLADALKRARAVKPHLRP